MWLECTPLNALDCSQLLLALCLAQPCAAATQKAADRNAMFLEAARPVLVPASGHASVLRAISVSLDGRRALTADAGSVILWDVPTGRQVRRFDIRQVSALALSNDGTRMLVGESSGMVFHLNAATGASLGRTSTRSAVAAVRFPADGRKAAIVGARLLIWDVERSGKAGAQLGEADFTLGTLSANGAFAVVVRRADEHQKTQCEVWDTVQQRMIKSFAILHQPIALAVSDDGRSLLLGFNEWMTLWSVELGSMLKSYESDSRFLRVLAFAPSGTVALSGGQDSQVVMWNLEDGAQIGSHATDIPISALAILPGSDRAIISTTAGSSVVWNFRADSADVHLRRYAQLANAVRFSRDGSHLLVASWAQSAYLWNLQSGQVRALKGGHRGRLIAVAFSPSGSEAFTAGADRQVVVWDVEQAKVLRRIPTPSLVESLAVSPDGGFIAAGLGDRTVAIIDARAGKVVDTWPGHSAAVTSVSFSPDGRRLLSASIEALVREFPAGVEIWRKKAAVTSVNTAGFSADGKSVVTGGDQGAVVWDLNSGLEVAYLGLPMSQARSERDLGHSGPVGAVALYAVGKLALTTGHDGTLIAWDVTRSESLARRTEHGSAILSLDVSRDENIYATASMDGSVIIWDAATHSRLATLFSLSERWTVVGADGRFDTGDAEQINELSWVFPGEPFTPLAGEVFLREYYEPRYLPRLLQNQRFAPVRPLGSLNRVLPTVRFAEVGLSGESPMTAKVTVEVTRGTSTASGAPRRPAHSVHDLRIFRNGQLVGQWPEPADRLVAAGSVAAWRDRSRVPLGQNQKVVRHTFLVPLSSHDRDKLIVFTGYAFNEDRVKSETARNEELRLPDDGPLRPRRAYVVAIGVDAYDNPSRKLNFAAKDARDIGGALARIRDHEVVLVTLLSQTAEDGAAPLNQATKANIRTVLGLLAGDAIAEREREGLARVPRINAEAIRRLVKATPDDLVVISFSGHGHTQRTGKFYLLPSDSGTANDTTPAVLSRLISSEELSQWLRRADAGQMAMIIDACHSAASVDEPDFKPGPMGDRGLGQLAYDKGTRILAASQTDAAAMESSKLRQGLLTYALVHDGFALGADGKLAADADQDGELTLAEWLRWGEQRTSVLYVDIQAGRRDAMNSTRDGVIEPNLRKRAFSRAQTPVLFDFARRRIGGVDVVLH